GGRRRPARRPVGRRRARRRPPAAPLRPRRGRPARRRRPGAGSHAVQLGPHRRGARRRLPGGRGMSRATAPVRVGVNLLWLVPGEVGGSEEYTLGLMRALSDLAPEDLDVTL